MGKLTPDGTFMKYDDLTAERLREMGITVLLLDIDNTLAPYEQPLPDEHLKTWLTSLKEAGIRAAFLSNNHGERVGIFNAELGLPFRCNAKKPLKKVALELMKSEGGTPATTAFLGDQLFTDVLCAHRVGARAFVVPPIRDRKDALTKGKRVLERPVLKRYYKAHPEAADVRKPSPLRKDVT